MRARTLAIALLGLAAVVGSVAPAGAGSPPASHVDVIEVSGLVDPVTADFVTDAIAAAERTAAQMLVIQLDSSGSVLGATARRRLIGRLRHARVPIGVWVGPSGAHVVGRALDFVVAADIVSVSPGSRLRCHCDAVPAIDHTFPAAPTLGDFIVELDGRRIEGRTLATAEVVRRGSAQPRRRPTVTVRFAKLGLLARLLHTAASPSVAYLLLLAGLLLVVFEFFTAGVGVAAAGAAGCLVLASYGLGVLPARGWAVALLAVGVAGYAVDVQAGAPRTWTVIGTVTLAAGTAGLYDGLRPSPLAMLAGVAGAAAFMVAGMPAMVRARFSTPTIGRESMIGELGDATTPVDPEGVVVVRGAPWRARTNRATPIGAGDPVRVAGIDGLLLEVEPLEGAARDAGH